MLKRPVSQPASTQTSHPTFEHSPIFLLLGVVMLLVLSISIAMIWQSLNSVREINRQKTITAVVAAASGIQEKILITEMMAGSIQTIVMSGEEDTISCAHFCLRTALTSAVSAFEQHPQLSQLGLIIPESGVFGNLERLENGNIALWLAPEEGEDEDNIQSLLWTGNGFMPYLVAQMPAGAKIRENLRRLGVQQTAAQEIQSGSWQLRDGSWMVQSWLANSSWGIGYSKALHDERGRIIGVFDAQFSLDSIQASMQALQQSYGIKLTVIGQTESAWMIRTDASQPLPLWPEFASLIEDEQTSPSAQVFTDVLSLEGDRHWAGIKPLSLQGKNDWQLIVTRLVPWRDVMMGERMIYVLSVALLVIAGSGVVLIYMMVRLRRTQNMKIHADLDYRATHDDLTGLANRLALDRHFKNSAPKARADEAQIALLYLAFDRFKIINDSYGHQYGNRVLRAAGEMLAKLIREQDMVIYLNGDRFIILLDQLHHKDEARRLTHQIMEGLKRSLIVEERELHLVASIGVSLYPSHGETLNTLINNADIAMYEAKKSGGDCYQFFTPTMGEKIQEDLDLEVHLQDALAENQLHLVYQPKLSLHNGKITGCEALLRWTHPELGPISPARFIPIAENAGLIVSIGDWALRTACIQAKSWLDSGFTPICVAVNLSMRQFLRRDVVKWVANILQQTGLPAQCLELELTESLLPQDMERAIGILEQLHTLGIKMSLDDFGTGYSNLSYLKRLRVDTLKIDQAFVRGALGSAQDGAIVRAIVDLAHNLGYKALAEGVETQAQLDFVRAQGCDEIQGYYFSRPVAAEAYAIMLRDGLTLDNIAAKN